MTTNRTLVYSTQKFNKDSENTISLLISDLDLTTLLWLKNHKRFSDLPALKLIETARLSLEPTEQIRDAFVKKIEQFKCEPTVTPEIAASFRQLIYTEKEKVMELIHANPENVSKLELNDLEQLSRQHYNSQLTNENQELKRQFDETKRRLWVEANDKIDNAGKKVEKVLKAIIYLLIATFVVIGVVGLFMQSQENVNTFTIVVFIFGIIGLVDAIIPRLHLVNKAISTVANKRKAQIRRIEQERIQKILIPNSH